MRQLLAELRGIRAGIGVAAAGTIILLWSLPLIDSALYPDQTVIFAGALIPVFWALILFESFRPTQEQFGFIAGMPVKVNRVFRARLLIYGGIILIATAISWRYLDYRRHFIGLFDIDPWLLWLVLIAAMLFLAQVCRGMELCVVAVIVYPLLVWNQLPVQLLYMFFVPGGGYWFTALQISVLLAIGAMHIWRARCLNRSLRGVIMPWILFLAVLPWLEYGICAGYFYLDYRLALSRAERSGVMIVPEEIDTGRYGYLHHVKRSDEECAKIVADLLNFYGYRPGAVSFLQAIDSHGTLTSYLENRVKECYRRDDTAGILEEFRIYNYLCGFNGLMIDRLSYQEVKPELYRMLIGELEQIADRRLAPKMGIALGAPMYWYLPRRRIDSNHYLWRNYKGLLEIIYSGIRARMIHEAVFYLKYYRKYQAYPPWNPWEKDIRPNGYWWAPNIRKSIAVLSLRLYAHEHGEYPEQLPAEIQKNLEYPFSYRKTLNGFEILYGKNKGSYYAYPRQEDSW